MDRYRVSDGGTVRLADRDPRDRSAFSGGKAEGRARLRRLNESLAALQRLLWADGKQKVLMVLQGMDTGGKDGTIRHVFRGVNPQGVRVAGFKVPTSEELAHDYLWRVHRQTPGSGEIVIFNRSHYEDVLVVRVFDLVPEPRWSRRYDHINAFERLLADEGTTILKFFLHISKEEQEKRLRARIEDPTKNWKFKAADLEHRARWDDYVAAYEEAISRTSTPHAPWHIVPADRKWYRNLVVSEVLVDTLRELDMAYPEPDQPLDGISIV